MILTAFTAFYLIQTAFAGKLIELTQGISLSQSLENFKVNPIGNSVVVFIPHAYCKFSPHVESVI